MMRLFASILLAASATVAAVADTVTASAAWTAVPDAVFPLIDRETRLDMLDYYNAGSPRASQNRTGAPCRIVELTDTVMTIALTETATATIFVIDPDSPRPVIGVITTLATPIEDSTLQLYNHRWEPIGGAPEIRLVDWVGKLSKRVEAQARELPFILATYTYDQDNRRLVVHHNMAQYFTDDDRPEILNAMRPELQYRWNAKKQRLEIIK